MSTILGVALLAAVSTATVSGVLNSAGSLRKKTCDKALRAIKKCNYKHIILGRGFATKRSNTIGLIIPNINNLIKAQSERQMDGITITTANLKSVLHKSLAGDVFSVVLLFKTANSERFSSVGKDKYRGDYLATSQLISPGHRLKGMVVRIFL